MSNVVELFNEFKTKVEKEKFLLQQHITITALVAKNQQLLEEVEHLKKLLLTTSPLIPVESKVEKVIVTLEEALIERQIELIQSRALDRELTLEDTKKLDLLIKNKRLAKEQSTTIQGESKKLDKKHYSNAELIHIVSAKKDSADGSS